MWVGVRSLRLYVDSTPIDVEICMAVWPHAGKSGVRFGAHRQTIENSLAGGVVAAGTCVLVIGVGILGRSHHGVGCCAWLWHF